jgi:hypothetical protein
MQLMASSPRFGLNTYPLKGYEKRELKGFVQTYRKVPADIKATHFQEVNDGLDMVAKVLIPHLKKLNSGLQALATTTARTPLAEPALRQAYLRLKAAEREVGQILASPNYKLGPALQVLKDGLKIS